MGEKSEEKSYFNNRHCAKYFTDEFIITTGQEALKAFPDLDDRFIPLLQRELKRMQELFFQSKKKSIKPLPKVVKCCSIKCKSTGNLDTKNTDKYAQCEVCKRVRTFQLC